MAFERKCIVDLKDYKYCNNCNEFNPTETWRFLFCCENCRDIYHTVEDCNAGKITADEAKERLEKYDLSGLSHFQKFVKRDIEGIFEAATKDVPVTEVEVTETVNSESISAVISEPEDNHTATIVKPRSRKRKPVVTEEKIDE